MVGNTVIKKIIQAGAVIMKESKLQMLILVSIVFHLVAGWAYAATFTVTNLNDSGGGSLRWAIEQANTNTGPDTIDFDVSGTIAPKTALPRILDDRTTVDASAQWAGLWPSGQPGITLDGTGAEEYAVGLEIASASDCHIRGFFITNFGDGGIIVSNGSESNTIGGISVGERNVISGNNGNGLHINNSNNNLVVGNYIGTDVNGLSVLGNSEDGIYIEHGAKSNIVGDASPAGRNIISGNRYGLWITGSGTNDNKISGNYIGTDVSGTIALGNSGGIVVSNEAQLNTIGGSTTGERNIISGNEGIGIGIEYSDENRISGNYIGINVNGNGALGNGRGVTIAWDSQINTIGGATTGERNIVSGNRGTGIGIFGSGADDNSILGNYIGTDSTGAIAIGNLYNGISIFSGAQSNIIGGAFAGEGNTISGNERNGLSVSGSGTQENVIKGNYIGTDFSGNSVIGNIQNGVLISDEAQFNIIGGEAESERNIISGNGSDGVEIRGKRTKHNVVSSNYIGLGTDGNTELGNTLNGVYVHTESQSNTIDRNIIAFNGQNGVSVNGIDTNYSKISRNSIHNNSGSGIELEDGGNDLIAAPTIVSQGLVGSILKLSGTGAGANASVEIFGADSLESGEGEIYLRTLNADIDGEFSGQIDLAGAGLSVISTIVATTIHTDNNTSEFAAPIPVSLLPPDDTSSTIGVSISHAVIKGDSFSVSIEVGNINDLAGFQFDVSFDPTVLEVVSIEKGTFLSATSGTYWLEPGTDNNTGLITDIASARTAKGGANGSGTLAIITFKAIQAGESHVRLQSIVLSDSTGRQIPATSVDAAVTVMEFPPWDVNRDGVISIFDIVLIGQYFGEIIAVPQEPNPDVNGDGRVDVRDIVLVVQHFGEVYLLMAPSQDLCSMDPLHLPVLLRLYGIMENSPDSSPGFLDAKQLIQSFILSTRADRTEAFQNYPNPFNPETWIPYQLAENSEVTVRIYDANGKNIRKLGLGYKSAGIYMTKGRSAHWDGRNAAGERVASGIFFYTVQAGDFSATRKMVVQE